MTTKFSDREAEIIKAIERSGGVRTLPPEEVEFRTMVSDAGLDLDSPTLFADMRAVRDQFPAIAKHLDKTTTFSLKYIREHFPEIAERLDKRLDEGTLHSASQIPTREVG